MSASYDAYEQGYLAAILAKKLADRAAINTGSRDVYTRLIQEPAVGSETELQKIQDTCSPFC